MAKGIYRVGTNCYANKLEACLALNQLPEKHHLHWDYHESVFGLHEWHVEPTNSITELYRQRAQQLRHKYDHLVLFYSGGADSHTVLQSFVKNNIHLDEVYIYGAFKAEENKIHQLGWDRSPGYYTREVLHIAKPILEELQKTHKFKITVWDWTDKTLQALENRDWFWDVGTRFAPDTLPRQYLHEAFRHSDRFEDKGKKVGFIFGVDKPRLFRDKHSIYFAFIDQMLTTAVGNNSDIHGRYWEHDEYFYWSPDLPQLVIKQAHLIYNHLIASNSTNCLTHIDDVSCFHASDYYAMIHPLIYPNWPCDTWQIRKSTSVVKDEFGQWFFDLAPQPAQKSWVEGIEELQRLLGPRHFNQGSVWQGLIGCLSKFYRVGSARKHG